MSRFCPEQDWRDKKRTTLRTERQHHRDPNKGVRETNLKLTENDKCAIWRKQEGKAKFSGLPIEDYHHVPSIRDIEEAGQKRGCRARELGVGVDTIGHALFHYAEYLLTGDGRHLEDATGIMCRFDDKYAVEAQDEYCRRMGSPEFEKIVDFVRARRKQYGLETLRVRLDKQDCEEKEVSGDLRLRRKSVVMGFP